MLFLAIFCAGTGMDARQASAAGGDILWQYDDAKPAKQEAFSSVADSAGNIIVVGSTQNGSEDFFTAKINQDGSSTAWTATFDLAGGADRAMAVTVDQNEDVLVSGYAWNGVNYDFHTIKYNGSDGSVAWQNTFNAVANGTDIPTDITVDSLGNVYVCGNSQGSSGTDDFMLIKYSPSGANPDGSPVWQQSYNGTGNGQDRINAIAAGTNGVAVSGYSHNGSDYDYLTIKYGFDGSQTWLKTHNAGSGDDRAQATAMDGSGNVLVTGYVYNTNYDIYTVKYSSSDGTVLWSKTYSDVFDDQGRDLWIDAAGDVYITGTSYTITGFNDFYTAKYAAADGALAWEKIYNSSGSDTDIPIEIIVDSAGEVFITGYTGKVSGDDDILTVKYRKDNGTLLWVSGFDGTAGKDERSVGIGSSPDGNVVVGGWSDMWTAGSSDYDFYAIKYDAGLLNAPTDLNAEVVSETEISLSWSDNAAAEDGFRVWRKLGEQGDWGEIGTTAADVTTYNDPGVTPHVWYYYRVQAYSAALGDSQFSNVAPVLTTLVSYPAPTWTYIFNNADDNDDYAYAIAVGPDNNPVVTGTSLRITSSYDYHTVKLDRLNVSEIWSVDYNDVDEEMDIATGVVVDSNNDVVVTGNSSLYGGGASNTNDIYTLKYASTGPPAFGDPYLWDDQYNGPAGDDDRSESIDAAVDGSNSTVVVGYGKNASANDDIYVIKYLTDGTRQWAATPFNGASNGNDYPARVVFDASGDVIVTGKTHNGSDYDIITRKLSGSDGSTIWTKIHDSTNGWDGGRDVAVDNNDDVYVAGVVVNASGNDDIYLIKYNGTNGSVLWEKIIDGPGNGNDIGETVQVDPNDNQVVVAGTVLAGAGNNDFYLARYEEDSTLVWERQLERVGNDDNAIVMGMDISGNVCLAGNTDNADSIDLLAVKYDKNGNILGGTLFNGGADDDDDVFGMAVNSLGEQFISGYTTNASGNADYLVVMCMGDVLQAPSPLTVTPYYTSVDLDWTDTTSDEDGFYVERKLDSCDSANPWELIHTAAAGEEFYSDTGLNQSATYCYRVQTFKNTGEESSWLTREVTTTEPPAPSGFAANPANTTRISLSWTDNTTGEDGFLVERCSGAGCSSYALLDLPPADATSFNDDSVCENSIYSYRILAYKSGDWQSVFSAPDVDNATPALAAPTGLSASRVSEGEIRLDWTDNTSDETGFNIERCTGSGCSSFAPLAAVGAGTTSYNDTDSLDPNTTYRYRINAYKTADCPWATAWATPVEAATTLSTPTLTGGPANTTRIDLSWGDDFGFETNFEIERCSGSACSSFAPLTTVAADTTAYSDTSVCESSVYNYRVRATRTSAPTWNSGWSNTIEAAASTKQAPDTLSVTWVSEEKLSITWYDNSPDESGFEIDRCEGSGCDFSTKTTVTVGSDITSYVDLALTPDTTYRYQVRAYKTADCPWQSDNSAAAEATTTLYGPDGLTAAAVDTTTIDLAWNDNSSHETGFAIERCSGSGCSGFTEIAREAPEDCQTAEAAAGQERLH
jgi:uncharacterized delta-60 repeat protein